MGREGRCKQITLACARSVSAILVLPPLMARVPSLPHCSGCRLLRQELSEAGPGLHAPPRSKPLRFRHSGSPQGRRIGWACVLCPSQVPAAQVIRCLASTVAATYQLPHPCRSVFRVYNRRASSGVTCLFWGADLWLRPSWQMSTIRNPKKSWLATKSAFSLVEDASLGPRLPPSGSGRPPLPVSSRAWAGPQPASSAQSFVL